MNERRFGINLFPFGRVGDLSSIDRMAALGFRATFSSMMGRELHRTVDAYCRKRGIAHEAIHAPFSHINDIWRTAEPAEVALRELTDTVERCAELGVPVAVVHLSSGEGAPRVNEQGLERFDRLVRLAEAYGVTVAFENQRQTENLGAVLNRYTTPSVGFCYDCGHELCFTRDIDFLALFGDRLTCVHLHDNSGVYNADEHRLPGDGVLDTERLVRRLSALRFGGTMMLELHGDYYPHTEARFCADTLLRRAAEVGGRLARAMG